MKDVSDTTSTDNEKERIERPERPVSAAQNTAKKLYIASGGQSLSKAIFAAIWLGRWRAMSSRSSCSATKGTNINGPPRRVLGKRYRLNADFVAGWEMSGGEKAKYRTFWQAAGSHALAPRTYMAINLRTKPEI